VNKTLFYIGIEKPIINIKKYGFFKNLIKKEFVTLTTFNILEKHSDLPNVQGFTSKWSFKDTEIFHLNLLWRNFFNRKNTGLKMDLRVRCFGPYKIKTLSNLISSFGYLKNIIFQTKWSKVILLRNKSPNLLLNDLRKSTKIGNGDLDQFKKILVRNKISNVVTFSSFRDPKLYDLVMACNELKVDIYVFIECWDNISTAYSIPSGITKIFLWSTQQKNEINKFYPEYTNKAEVIGGYRINKALEFAKKRSTLTINSYKNLSLLYLEGYFYEDLNYVINKLMDLIIFHAKKQRIGLREVNLIIRRYPLKRQSSIVKINKSNLERKITIENINFNIRESKKINLYDDFLEADLVLSELTTAGLEAAFGGLPVIFVSSKKSPRFLDTSKGYEYSFANKISRHFSYIKFRRFFSIKLIPIIPKQSIFEKSGLSKFKVASKLRIRDLDYYAKPFNFMEWDVFISNLKK